MIIILMKIILMIIILMKIILMIIILRIIIIIIVVDIIAIIITPRRITIINNYNKECTRQVVYMVRRFEISHPISSGISLS